VRPLRLPRAFEPRDGGDLEKVGYRGVALKVAALPGVVICQKTV